MSACEIYLDDILNSIQIIRKHTHGMTFRDFDDNDAIQDAVARRLEIIGEAAKRLPVAIRNRRADIPWKQVCGMRDILIHEYAGVSTKTLWTTVTEDLGILEKAVKELRRAN